MYTVTVNPAHRLNLPTDESCFIEYQYTARTLRTDPLWQGMAFGSACALVRRLNKAAAAGVLGTCLIRRGARPAVVLGPLEVVRMLAEDWQQRPDHDRIALLNASNLY